MQRAGLSLHRPCSDSPQMCPRQFLLPLPGSEEKEKTRHICIRKTYLPNRQSTCRRWSSAASVARVPPTAARTASTLRKICILERPHRWTAWRTCWISWGESRYNSHATNPSACYVLTCPRIFNQCTCRSICECKSLDEVENVILCASLACILYSLQPRTVVQFVSVL